MNAAFTSEDCNRFEQALELARDMLMRSQPDGSEQDQDADCAQAALTLGILDRAARGERNVRRLALSAAAQVDRFEARIKARRPTLCRFLSDPTSQP